MADNGSTDGTSAMVEERFPRVVLLRLRENLGAVARNIAVRHVTTPYVLFCDDDTWWRPEAPDRAADLLDAHPRLASVTGLILVEPDRTEDPLTAELRKSPLPAPPWLPGPALLGILAGASMLRVRAFLKRAGSPRGCGWAERRSCWRSISRRRTGGCAGPSRWWSTTRPHPPGTPASGGAWASVTRCGRRRCAFPGPTSCGMRVRSSAPRRWIARRSRPSVTRWRACRGCCVNAGSYRTTWRAGCACWKDRGGLPQHGVTWVER